MDIINLILKKSQKQFKVDSKREENELFWDCIRDKDRRLFLNNLKLKY